MNTLAFCLYAATMLSVSVIIAAATLNNLPPDKP